MKGVEQISISAVNDGNDSLYQQMALVCIGHLRRESRWRHITAVVLHSLLTASGGKQHRYVSSCSSYVWYEVVNGTGTHFSSNAVISEAEQPIRVMWSTTDSTRWIGWEAVDSFAPLGAKCLHSAVRGGCVVSQEGSSYSEQYLTSLQLCRQRHGMRTLLKRAAKNNWLILTWLFSKEAAKLKQCAGEEHRHSMVIFLVVNMFFFTVGIVNPSWAEPDFTKEQVNNFS